LPGKPLRAAAFEVAEMAGWLEYSAGLELPRTVLQDVVTDSRPLCLYPKFARHIGHGSTTVASSFICAR
jgi:hypothetical protein